MTQHMDPKRPGYCDDDYDCRSAMDRLFDLLDGELTPERELKVRAHIVGCPGCFSHANFEERFIKAIRTARGESVPGTLRDRVEQALRADGWVG